MKLPQRSPFLFALWTAQGLIAFAWLLLLPSDSESFSASRLALLGMTLTVSGFSAWLWFRSQAWKKTPRRLSPALHNLLYLLALSAALGAPLTLLILRALGQTVSFTYTAYAQRLAPLAFWFGLAGFEWWLAYFPSAEKPAEWRSKPFGATFLVFALTLALTAAVVFSTRWGLTPTRDGSFGQPPTPLLEWQLALALILGLTAAFTLPRLNLPRLDLILFILVYLLTCLLWFSDPLIPGYFATPPRAPNYQPYPFSDALIYAQYAQSALVGQGFAWPEVPTRPMYVALLTWMHALAGQDYTHVIALQTLLLAFFPAVLYLLGKELGSRPLGLMLALLAALRDMTTNHAAPFALNYSYSKLFFSEMPTALLLVIFTLLALRWMKAPKPAWYLLAAGGVLGAAALVRLQSAVLLAPLAVATLPALWQTRRAEWLRGLALMTVGAALALAPWLLRNHQAAGGLVLDNPISQSMVLARRWSGDNGNELIPQQPGESVAQYSSRMTAIALDNLRHEPGRILGGAANHFFNNLIDSLLVLPIRDQLNSPAELLWPEHAFWQTGAQSAPLVILYLALFALGLAASWSAWRWAGLLPLALGLGYHAWTALFLSSGDRFLIPIDWAAYLYPLWGLWLLGRLAMAGLGGASAWKLAFHNGEKSCGASKSAGWRVALTGVVILLVGASLPFSELLFPKKYPALTQAQLSAEMGLAPQAGERLVYGRAIYPRFYAAGEGEPGTAKLGYALSGEARLVFWLVGPKALLVILPLDSAPGFFPHAADVWVVGQMEGDVLRARWARVTQAGQTAVVER